MFTISENFTQKNIQIFNKYAKEQSVSNLCCQILENSFFLNVHILRVNF